MKAEIIVAIVSLVVALPPTLYALYAWYGRRSQSTCEYLKDACIPTELTGGLMVGLGYPSHRAHLSRRRSEIFCSVSDRGITLALRVEDGLPTTSREPILRVSNPGMALSC